MAATSTDLQQAPAVPRRRRSLLRAPISGIAGRIGITLVLFTIALVVIGPYVAPYSPFNIGATTPASGPTAAHWMGGDLVGRDVFSRFLDGGRSVILIPTVGVVIALVIGAVVGMWCGFRGGLSDSLIARLVDISFALPPLMVGLLLVTGFGTSSIVLVAVVVVLFAPRILRVIRGATHALVGQEFVLAAIARGESTRAIIRNEIAPNLSGPILAEGAIRLTYAIVLIATLNYLGLGVQPPTANWGLMVSENLDIIAQDPLACLAPAAGIAIMCIGVSLVADQVGAYFARNVSEDGRP